MIHAESKMTTIGYFVLTAVNLLRLFIAREIWLERQARTLMLNHAALTSSIVALLGTIAPAQAWESTKMFVEPLSLSDLSGANAYGHGGAGWRLMVLTPARSTRTRLPSSAEEGRSSLRDVVGSVPTPHRLPDEPALFTGIGSFSFCEFGEDANSEPFLIGVGFGSEARLRQHWAARIETFHYDLGSVDFMALPSAFALATSPPMDVVLAKANED